MAVQLQSVHLPRSTSLSGRKGESSRRALIGPHNIYSLCGIFGRYFSFMDSRLFICSNRDRPTATPSKQQYCLIHGLILQLVFMCKGDCRPSKRYPNSSLKEVFVICFTFLCSHWCSDRACKACRCKNWPNVVSPLRNYHPSVTGLSHQVPSSLKATESYSFVAGWSANNSAGTTKWSFFCLWNYLLRVSLRRSTKSKLSLPSGPPHHSCHFFLFSTASFVASCVSLI